MYLTRPMQVIGGLLVALVVFGSVGVAIGRAGNDTTASNALKRPNAGLLDEKSFCSAAQPVELEILNQQRFMFGTSSDGHLWSTAIIEAEDLVNRSEASGPAESLSRAAAAMRELRTWLLANPPAGQLANDSYLSWDSSRLGFSSRITTETNAMQNRCEGVTDPLETDSSSIN